MWIVHKPAGLILGSVDEEAGREREGGVNNSPHGDMTSRCS